MADDKIVISAIARVVDLATGPLKAIQKAITGVSEVAAKTGTAVSGMGAKVGGALAGMSGRFGAATSRIGNFARSVDGMITPLRGLIGLAGIGGVTLAMTNFINKSKEIAAASTRLGVSTDMVQVFANVFGDSTERATEAMSQLQKTLAKMRAGGKGVADTTKLFAKMGVTAQQIAKGDLGEILPTIMESFKKTKDPVLRAAMAMKIFGKSGQELIPFLVKGKEGFADAVDEMVKMGIVSEDIAAGLKAGVALKEFGNVVESVSNTIIAQFLPAITGIVKDMSKWVKANKDLLKQVALPAFIGAIAGAVVALGIAVAGALGHWGLLAAAVVAAGVAIYQNWDPIVKWIDQQVPGLTKTITQAGNDIAAWAKRSAKNISKGFEEGGIVGGVTAYVVAVKEAWVGVGEWFADLFRKIDWPAVGRASAQLMLDAMRALWQANLNIGQWIIDKVKEALAWSKTADWEGLGKEGGRLMAQGIELSLKSLLSFTWLAAKLAEGMKEVNWIEVAKSVAVAFLTLEIEFKRIGSLLIKGMIVGMWEFIPGAKAVSDYVGKLFEQKPNPYAAANAAGAPPAPAPPRSPMDLRPGGPTDRLLQLAKPEASKSEVTITNKVVLPNGGTVETQSSSTGAPLTLKNVGQSQTVMP